MSEPSTSKTMFYGGSLVLLGLWLGWWLTTRGYLKGGVERALPAPAMGKLADRLRGKGKASMASAPSEPRPAGLVSTRVESAGAKILEQSRDRARSVLVATTQPVRISPQGTVRDNPDSGLPVMPGDQPTSLGILPPGQELYAALPQGGVPAMVTLWLQEV
jgi:hypothetical protein